MSVRFRIRTPGGQELSFASQAMFEDFVRSGDLSPDDLVYDAEDGSWAPARTHPIVLDIEYEDEEEVRDEPDAAVPVDATTAEGESNEDAALGLSLTSEDETPAPVESEEPTEEVDLGLELAMTTEVSPEEAQKAFVERMAAERATASEFGVGDAGLSGFRMETAGSMAGMVTPEPEAEPEGPKPLAPGSSSARARPETPSSSGVGRLVGGGVLVALLAVGGWFGLQAREGGADQALPAPDTPVEPIEVEVEPEPTPEPVIASTPAAVRERARERFLTATQTELRSLEAIPASWPGGTYLTLPSGAPEVLDVWQSYLTTIRRVREGDVERYRVAYEAALDDAVIEGEERVTRLDTAMVAFDVSLEAREAHYDRVESLASAAIQSHNALLEIEGLLLFSGTGEGVADGPIGAGVTARDADSELLLSQVVDLLTGTLEAEGFGPGTGDNVRAWVWDGFLNAVAN